MTQKDKELFLEVLLALGGYNQYNKYNQYNNEEDREFTHEITHENEEEPI